MKELRERGLYRLPDGGEFVASSAPRGGGYALYDPPRFGSLRFARLPD